MNENIIGLLSGDNEDFTQQGLELIKGLNPTSAEALFTLLGIPEDNSNPTDFEMHFKDYPCRGLVLQELYLMLESFGTTWALERKRTFDINLDQYDGRPFTYWIDTVPKAFYEYWEANGGIQQNNSLFQFICGLTNSDNWPEEAQKNISTDRPMTLEEARATLVKMREDEWMSGNLPENIPDEAFIFPTEHGIYQFNKVDHDWIMFLNPDPEVEVFVSERYACSEWDAKTRSVICKIFLKDLGDTFPNTWKHIQTTFGIELREEEYFMNSWQSEKASLGCSITLKGPFDMNKFAIQSKVDHYNGIVLTDESFSYDNEPMKGDWQCYSADPYSPSLHKGLPHTMFVKKLDTGEHFAIDPTTKEWTPPNEGDFDPFGDDSPLK